MADDLPQSQSQRSPASHDSHKKRKADGDRPYTENSNNHINGGQRRTAFACSNCRRRKAKCDATRPRCYNCNLYDEDCQYEQVPSRSYVRSLEDRVTQLEQLLHSVCISQGRERDELVQSIKRGVRFEPSNAIRPNQRPAVDTGAANDASHDANKDGDGSLVLSLDQSGNLNHHNLTSFYAPHQDTGVEDTNPTDQSLQEREHGLISTPNSQSHAKAQLIRNALEQRSRESAFLTGAADDYLQLPVAFYEYLLECHWRWIQPFFNFIYRPAFMREMGMGRSDGQYFSSFLLYTVLAHSSRFCKSHERFRSYIKDWPIGDYFITRAKSMIPQEISRPRVATVQGLLLLSANASSTGSRSEAWTFSGMAFRMLTDMGLHLNMEKLGRKLGLSEEDLEIRRRLFWSAYLWDKVISLYFGRKPAFTDSSDAPPPLILDDSAENELWMPYFTHEMESQGPLPLYPPTPTHGISNFIAACELSKIINRAICELYTNNHGREANHALYRKEKANDITAQLQSWRDGLPSHLGFNTSNHPGFPPPSHISNLNLLYHTTVILVNRPLLSLDQDNLINQDRCLDAARSILLIVDLWRSGFGECRFVIVAYAIYAAAGAFIFLLKSLLLPAARTNHSQRRHSHGHVDLQAVLSDLHKCSELLKEVARTCPGIDMPSQTVEKHLSTFENRLTAGQSSATDREFVIVEQAQSQHPFHAESVNDNGSQYPNHLEQDAGPSDVPTAAGYMPRGEGQWEFQSSATATNTAAGEQPPGTSFLEPFPELFGQTEAFANWDEFFTNFGTNEPYIDWNSTFR